MGVDSSSPEAKENRDQVYRRQVMERRRRVLYAFLLLACLGILLVYLLLLFTDLSTDIPVENLDRVQIATIVLWLSALATYLLARRGAAQAAATLFLGVMLLVAAAMDDPQQVMGGRSMISFPILIVIAGLVLPPSATFVWAGAVTLATGVLTFFYTHDYLQAASNIIVYFVVAAITWIFTSRLERANDELAHSQADLAALNAELEDRVEQRTDELYRANAELARSSQLKDEFLATMSHELRTPLAEVLMVCQVLEAGVYGPLTPIQEQKVQQVQAGGKRLLKLIQQVLDYAQLQTSDLQLARRPALVADLCQAAVAEVADAAAARRQPLQWCSELDAGACVLVDPESFQRILAILLDNASKFTPAGGALGLDVRPGALAGSVEFVVWDTGIGIAPEHLTDLFQPFHQVDSRLSRVYEGAGLSLALAQRLAALHGGAIQVASTPGRGSRFTVVLPGGGGMSG